MKNDYDNPNMPPQTPPSRDPDTEPHVPPVVYEFWSVVKPEFVYD